MSVASRPHQNNAPSAPDARALAEAAARLDALRRNTHALIYRRVILAVADEIWNRPVQRAG